MNNSNTCSFTRLGNNYKCCVSSCQTDHLLRVGRSFPLQYNITQLGTNALLWRNRWRSVPDGHCWLKHAVVLLHDSSSCALWHTGSQGSFDIPRAKLGVIWTLASAVSVLDEMCHWDCRKAKISLRFVSLFSTGSPQEMSFLWALMG